MVSVQEVKISLYATLKWGISQHTLTSLNLMIQKSSPVQKLTMGWHSFDNALSVSYRTLQKLCLSFEFNAHLVLGKKFGTMYKNVTNLILNIKQIDIEEKLATINNLHPSLKFTIKREENGSIPFLDMKIIHNNGQLSSTWYNKPTDTDTGLMMNYYALAPKKYKRSVVSGFVYRIYCTCSSWQLFHESMEKAKQVLERNQYPPSFYDPIIKDSLNTILQKCQ